MAADPRSFQRVGATSYRYRPSPKRRFLSIGATLAAVAAFAGILFYAYTYGAKSGGTAGGPPLVQADAGPTKVRPEQPGGTQVPFQENTVYDQVARDRKQPVVERLLPRPEPPMARPEPAPAPVATAAPIQPPMPGPAAQPNMVVAGTMPPGAVAAPLASGNPQKPAPSSLTGVTMQPPVQQQATAPPPAAPVTRGPASPPAQAAPPAQASVPVRAFPAPAAGPATPPPAAATPTQRQPESGSSVAAVPPSASRTQPPAEVAPAVARPPSAGTVRLQLGSVPNEAEAKAEWARLKQRYPDLLGGMDMALQRADLGDKGIFYRIQAGPVDDARAQATCSKLMAQRVGCFIVRR